MRFGLMFSVLLFSLIACSVEEDPYRAVGELSSDRVELSAESNEPIIAILVAEGDTVTRGQLLLTQDPARAAHGLAEAQASLAQGVARVDELLRGPRKEKIEAARANVAGATQEALFRQSEFTRAEGVFEQNLSSREALDRSRALLDSANAVLDKRRAELAELLSGATVEELAQAEQAVKQAQARRDVAALALERTKLYAPVAGRIDSRILDPGERPTPGMPLMILLSNEQVYARVYVPEALRAGVSAGSAATLYVDGVAGGLAGRVRWVAAEAAYTPYYALTERDRGRLSYLAKVDITETVARLPDGVPVEVEFIAKSQAP
ncbi:MAG: HlyD family secretion protein [Halieaceae bacterium]|jgi:HlyD family secretion protein